eukprot:1150774-Pelagomonas_calceolata.AAC.1
MGTEFAGEFSELLLKNLIDHRTTAPNHPQADGLAERAVQTVKRALRHNCSTQASTKTSPYFMLYARHPVIPPAHQFADDLDLHNVENASRRVLARMQAAQKIGIITGENLKIAQHRGTLKYATIRGGRNLPSIKQIEAGDLVYLKHRVLDSVL